MEIKQKQSCASVEDLVDVENASEIVEPIEMILSQNDLEENGVTINFCLDGVTSEEMLIPRDTKISDLKLKPFENFYFVGWFKDEACTQRYEDDEIVTKYSNLFAKYRALTYAIAFPQNENLSFHRAYAKGESLCKVEVKPGSTFRFVLKKIGNAKKGKIKVIANGVEILPNTKGVYVLANITGNILIDVEYQQMKI